VYACTYLPATYTWLARAKPDGRVDNGNVGAIRAALSNTYTTILSATNVARRKTSSLDLAREREGNRENALRFLTFPGTRFSGNARSVIHQPSDRYLIARHLFRITNRRTFGKNKDKKMIMWQLRTLATFLIK